MKINSLARLLFVFVLLIITSSVVFSQKNGSGYEVYLKNGVIQFDENIPSINDKSVINEKEQFQDRFYRYIQFYDIPSQSQITLFEQQGIRFLEYIPQKVYVVSIPMNFNFGDFKTMNVRSLIEIPVEDKMDIRLTERPFPDWVIHGDEIRVLIKYFPDIDINTVRSELVRHNYPVYESTDQPNILIVQIDPLRINELATLSFVRYLDFEDPQAEPESDDGRNLHRANAIDVDYFGGYDFDGTGVSVAINDDGYVGPHIDFTGRTDQTNVANDFTGGHGDMTVGIVGAAGNLNPVMRGMAPGAFLWVRSIGGAFSNTLSLHQNEDVMVFSTSYSNGCNAGYTSLTQQVDEEISDNPSLIQIFSAGNSNNNDCGYGAGNQWGNITGGHKMGKNVMATANLDNNDILSGSSSRGPANDGRIKPDISAHGAGHYSTVANNSYAPGGGTSAAAPGIAGVLTQLHQAYRDFNNGNDAPSALLKASIMNTAYDLGNPGPDFKFGWGKINAYKAMKTLEEVRYITDSITNGNVDTHTLSVPAGVQEMRVMVYWHDVEASTSAAYALVNDLDMTITDLSSTVHYPLVLDHTPNPITLDYDAVPGNDSINNVEQIRILNPTQGNHTITITGAVIPFGSHDYYIVYEYYYDEIKVMYPNGGEGLIPGSTERLHWDAYGTSGTFIAEFTLNGSSWSTISNSIPGDARFFEVTIPNTVSVAKVRISRNSVSDESDAFFSIINTPTNIQIGSVCSGTSTINVTWDSVPNAISYDVYLLGAMYMDSITTSSNLDQTIVVANIYQDNWISIRARGLNGVIGRRAIAVKVDGSSCYLDCISDDDAGVESFISPLLVNESCSGSVIDVSVNLTNIGPNTQTVFPVYYQLNNNTIVTDTFNDILVGGAIEVFTFSQPLNIALPGTFTITVWTGLSNDGALCNDTLTTTFQYFNPIAAFPYSEDFQSGVFPPVSITIENPDGGMTWEEAVVTGSNGSQTNTAYVNNLVYNNQGGEDYLSIVTFDLSNTSYAVLEFDVAYAPYSSYYSDGLRIDLSTDCGQTYIQVYLKEGDSLSTTSGPNTSAWEPTSISDWRRDTIDLSAYTGGSAKIRFVNLNGWGNNLYVDNIGLINTNQPGYCIPVSNCNIGDDIDDFSFNTINQTGTGCGTNGYSNFLSLSTILEIGGTYTMSLNTNYSNQFVSVWIDNNNDTVFSLAERILFDFHLVNSGTLYSTDITIPLIANTGSHRMRVRTHWNETCEDPCIQYNYGETHDYTIIIIDALPPVVSLGSDISICEGESININANVISGLAPFSYLWSTGETTNMISVSPNIATPYFVTVTDSNNNLSVDDILISINSLPVINLGPDVTAIIGTTVLLDAGSGFLSYLWNTGETTQSILVSTTGAYSVIVMDNNSCNNSDEIQVLFQLTPGPGWNYSITGGNHSILIPNNANITIDGSSIDIGDYIGAFYDSLGTLACGGYMMWTGITGSVTAWGVDLGNDGFATGEEFKWKIWKYSTDTEYDALATYMLPPLMPNSGNFLVNGLSGIETLSAEISNTQTLQLVQGWSIISSYIQPTDPNVVVVFTSVVGEMIIMKDGSGNVYWPQWGFNGIGNIIVGQGYLLKMNSLQTLSITGLSVQPELTPVSVPAGWSILGYLRNNSALIADMLSPIVTEVLIVKNGDGNIYWPAFGINIIVNMNPGEGYQIKMNSAQVFTYPAN